MNSVVRCNTSSVTVAFRAFRANERLPDADELPDVGQQSHDHRDPRQPPAFRVDALTEAPSDVGAGRPVETHAQAVLPLEPIDRPSRRLIQQALRNEGFDPGAPDGLFGPRTPTAVRRRPAAAGAPPTG